MSVKRWCEVLEYLDFSVLSWYNFLMKNIVDGQTSNTEMVSITRAEYEKFQAQGARISALEKQIDLLVEAVRLSRKKQFGSSSEKLTENGYEQLSLLFNEAEVYLPTLEKNETTVAAQYQTETVIQT